MATMTHSLEYYLNNYYSEHWAFFNNVFDENQCSQIIDKFSNINLEDGLVDGDGSKKEDIRKSKLHFINSSDPENSWIFENVANAIHIINNDFFFFDIDKIECLQFSEYDSNYKGFYAKHVDMMHKGPGFRKLSFSIQLTDEQNYEGGELQLHLKPKPDIAPKKQGTMTVFPSWMLHEVSPVTSGVRHAIVGWVWGPRWK